MMAGEERGSFARGRPSPDLTCARHVTNVARDDDDDDDDDANLESVVAIAGLHARVDGNASMSREKEGLAGCEELTRRRKTER